MNTQEPTGHTIVFMLVNYIAVLIGLKSNLKDMLTWNCEVAYYMCTCLLLFVAVFLAFYTLYVYFCGSADNVFCCPTESHVMLVACNYWGIVALLQGSCMFSNDTSA